MYVFPGLIFALWGFCICSTDLLGMSHYTHGVISYHTQLCQMYVCVLLSAHSAWQAAKYNCDCLQTGEPLMGGPTDEWAFSEHGGSRGPVTKAQLAFFCDEGLLRNAPYIRVCIKEQAPVRVPAGVAGREPLALW